MEKITNYKFKDFLKVKDQEKLEAYLLILELLKPTNEIQDPRYLMKRKLPLTPVKNLTFGQVTTIRANFSSPTVSNMVEMIKLVTGLDVKQVYNIRIIDFYGAVNSIKEELIELSNMEANELENDDFDINIEAINANERMARFGVLNAINSLADDDITKWEIIEKMQYMVVFTKLRMDKEKLAIQKELNELQKKKMNYNV